MRKIILLLCFLCFAAATNADDKPMVGAFGGLNVNSMITDFSPVKVPGLIPALNSEFKNDIGLGYNLGMFAQFPLSKYINFGLKFTVSDWYSELYQKDNDNLLLNNVIVAGEFERRLKLKLNVFTLEPNFSFCLYKGFHLQAGIGMNFLASERAEYAESVTSPSDAVFQNNRWADDQAVRNDTAGRFDDVPAMMLSANFGAYYDIPLNKNNNVFISPGVYYNFGLTDHIKDIDWRMNQFQAQIAFKYAFDVEPAKRRETSEQLLVDTLTIVNSGNGINGVRVGKIETISSKSETKDAIVSSIIHRRTDTLFISKDYELYGNIYVLGVDENGNDIKQPRFVSEEFIDNRNQPMLNYIFFDSLSYEIPARYHKTNIADAKSFDIKSLYKKSNIETYYNILNIIGYRLANNPEAKITLKGCNSHTGGEKWNEILSRNRANEVANYLSSVWGIDRTRMLVYAQELPENYSYPANQPEKAEENRRVEIYSDNYDILAPIFINDTSVVNQPPKAKFIIESKSEAGFKDWRVNVINRNEAGFSNIVEEGAGKPPRELEINLQALVDEGFNSEKPLFFSLDLFDKQKGKFSSKEKQFDLNKITVQKKRTEKIGDFEIERFSLLLFDFVSDNLSPYNLRTIDRVKSIIKPNSNIRIIGHTDLLGDEKSNKALSLKRAESAYKALGRRDAIVEGRGEEEVLYDNSLPEGRIFSRTVDIIVSTPVDYDKK